MSKERNEGKLGEYRQHAEYRRLEARLEEQRAVLEQLQVARQRQHGRITELEAFYQADLSTAPVEDLEVILSGERSGDLAAARATLREIERRVRVQEEAIRTTESALRRVILEVRQHALDRLVIPIGKKLEELIGLLKALRCEEDDVMLETGLTPHMYFSNSWEQALEHRLEWYHKERRERGLVG